MSKALIERGLHQRGQAYRRGLGRQQRAPELVCCRCPAKSSRAGAVGRASTAWSRGSVFDKLLGCTVRSARHRHGRIQRTQPKIRVQSFSQWQRVGGVQLFLVTDGPGDFLAMPASFSPCEHIGGSCGSGMTLPLWRSGFGLVKSYTLATEEPCWAPPKSNRGWLVCRAALQTVRALNIACLIAHLFIPHPMLSARPWVPGPKPGPGVQL